MRQRNGAPANLGQGIILRAYKTSLPGATTDFQIIGNGNWFTFSGTPLLEDPKIIQTLNNRDVNAHTVWRWNYQRIELWDGESQLVLILPTLLDSDISNSFIRMVRQPADLTGLVGFYLHLKFHYSCLVGRDTTSIGMELQLARNRAGNLTQLRMLRLSNTRIVPENPSSPVPFGNLAAKLGGGGEEAIDEPTGPLLQAFASQSWTARSTSGDANRVFSKPVSINSLPTLCISNEDLHFTNIPTGAPGEGGTADIQIANLFVEGGAQVGRLTQTPAVEWLRGDTGSDASPWIITANLNVSPLWNAIHKTYQNSLLTIRPGNSTTFLPRLRDTQVTLTPLEVHLKVGIRQSATGTPPSFHQKSSELRIEILNAILLGVPRVWAEFALARQALSFGAILQQSPTSSLYPHGLSFSITLDEDRPTEAASNLIQSTRIGSLDLTFTRVFPAVSSSIQTQAKAKSVLSILNLTEGAAHPRFDCTLALPVAFIDPGGQDGFTASEFVPDSYTYVDSQNYPEECRREQRFRGDSPLVFADPVQRLRRRANASGKPPFWIRVHESNPPDYSQSVTIELHAASAVAPETQRVFVLQSDPFLVAVVEFPGFVRRTGTPTDIVALWSTSNPEGAAWQLLTEAKPFQMLLPPQGIGEEMPKALELAAKVTKPFESRFSPTPTETLQPSYTPQNFPEAPWNLMRILGFPGQRDAGAGVVELQYELLYGLSCNAKVPMLRLAEVFATLGAIPGRLPFDPSASPEATKFRNLWYEIAALYNSRVAMLEPRLSGANYGIAGAADTPQVLTLSEGVSCVLRPDADLFNPVALSVDPDSFPAANVDGLKGGATWGFESPRVYHAVLANPASTSAVITSPYLSSVGGSGFGKAGFDEDLSNIDFDTSIGRSSFYAVERLGRIGVYHNLARHVIEYDRSVDAGLQFRQPDFGQRPVLRKRREYVQILEPKVDLSAITGNYPDGGCVKSIEFKSEIILVDSTWASNVGDTGIKIPLWSRGAFATAKVYVRPEIVFHFAGAEGVDVECEITEPEKLVFYTDTQHTDPQPGDNTKSRRDPKLWPLVEGIDFVPSPIPAPNPAFPSSDINQPHSSDISQPIGLRAFTLAIAEGHGPIDLVYNRSTKALGTNIKTVTLQRLAGLDLGKVKTATIPAVQVPSALQNLALTVRTDLFTAVRNFQQTPGVVDSKISDLSTAALAGLTAAANARASGAVNAVDREKVIITRWVGQLSTQAQDFGTTIRSALKAVNATDTNYASNLRLAVQDGFATLKVQLDVVAVTPNAIAQFAKSAVEALNATKGDFKNLRIRLNAIGPVTTAEDFRTLVQQAIDDDLNKLRTAILSRAESWMPPVAAILNVVDQVIHDSINPLFIGLTTQPAVSVQIAQLDSALAKVEAKLDSSAYPELLALAGQSDILTRALDDALDKARDQVEKQIQDGQHNIQVLADAAFAKVQDAISSQTTKAGADVSNFINTVTGPLESLAKQEVQDLQAFQRAANESLAQAQQRLEFLRQNAERAVDHFAEVIQSSVPPIFKNLPAANTVPALLQRAFGEAPKIPNLDFSIPASVGYFYDRLIPEVSLTPLLSRVQGLGSAIGSVLSPLATSLPSAKLLERLIPTSLESFDLSSILPKFAGLDLGSLFSGLKMPSGAADKIHITHGLDQSAHRAWVQADIKFDLGAPSTLFSIGPLAVIIATATLQATVHLEADTAGKVTRTTTGSITGVWNLMVGGSPIITLNDTALTFNDKGQINFTVSPANVRLAAILQLLEKAISAYSPRGSGFSFLLSPSGIETVLALPIPNINFGTSGISNLSFGFNFGLEWTPNFAIKAGFSIGRRNAPFSLTIFILGGGGYIEASARYVPGASIVCSVSISLAATAGLAISLGPIDGGVAVFLGMEVDFQAGGGHGGDLRLGAYILITGHVSILGIVSATISLRLEATYGGGQFTGTGTFSISIKICWCFTLDISEQVSMTLGGNSTKAALELPFAPGSPFLAEPSGIVADVPAAYSLATPAAALNAATLYLNMIS